MADAPPPSAPDRIESWKEIARHFEVNVRTVQLWEQVRGLPVHRYPGPRGRVTALKSELDAWAAGKSAGVSPPEPSPAPPRLRKSWRWTPVVVGLGALLWFGASSREKPPLADCRLEGRTLIALDSQNREAWRYDLGHPISNEAIKHLGDDAKPWIGDLDGDGSTELLFLDPQSSQTSRLDRLLCLSRSGRLLWEFTPGRKVNTRKEQFDPPFRAQDFRTVRLGPGKGLAVIFISIHELYSPLQAVLLSPQGKVLTQYWHSGHVRELAVGDMDGDGRDEIYLSGVSNSYKAPTLVVLDPLTMAGASREENPDYQFQGFPPPHEIARILLPVSRPARGLSEFGVATRIRLLESAVAVDVSEAPWMEARAMNGLLTIFHFSPALELTQVAVGDNYDVGLRQAGRPGEHLTSKDLDDLRNVTYLTRPPPSFISTRGTR